MHSPLLQFPAPTTTSQSQAHSDGNRHAMHASTISVSSRIKFCDKMGLGRGLTL